ncbi:PhaM family polyhydroxyalkanoate granule multifunctional regulatory protein [Acidovorax sp. PRC11]|uniref:PhaM family polyhydroxyalkanoate granule multifunctional regulatory protein n=1 Tax=Acidovorax sp. PRC11 TaxID=2962592 RepID=UPI002881E354|nr:PhaM family polyhydroxyalkanoate granule multifunctional regulatory protein [Acidovorax sp. PRC11]MDT0140280.1 hypothetical protein [Acidovorax sp. PRC11]
MSTSHTSPPAGDTSPFGFGRFVPGFDFLQNLAKGATAGMPQMPSLSGWVAPTISVEELEKRIEELKAVQFWLDQNSRALSATVQALEVQKMTLATLQGMNVAMGDLAKAFTPQPPSPSQDHRAQAAPAPAPAPAAQAPRPDPFARPQAAQAPSAAPSAPGGEPAGAPAQGAAGAGTASAPGVVDPMQWWTALTSQFQQIAANAMSDVSKLPAMDATRGMAAEALKTATDMATQFAAQGMQGMQEAARKTSGVPADSAQGSRGAAARGAKRAAPEGTQAEPDAPPATKPRAKKTPAADAPPAAGARRAAGPRNRS